MNQNFTDSELYFKNLYDNCPMVYNDPLYRHFGHLFTSTAECSSVFLNGILEKSNKIFSTPLGETLFDSLSSVKACSVIFTRHLRYVPARFHSHTYIEIICQIRGSSLHNINGKQLKGNPGDIIIIPPYTYHSIISPYNDSLTVNIGLKLCDFEEKYADLLSIPCTLSDFFNSCLCERKPHNHFFVHTEPGGPLSSTALNALRIQEMEQSDPATPFFLHSAANEFLSLLYLQHKNDGEIIPRISSNIDRIIAIMAYITINYRDTNLEQLASHFHFTVPYISRMIKSGTGHTFSELLTNVRINNSLLMLENTRLPVAEIANLMGYKAPENYMRTFKSVYKLTPTEYRKSKKNLNFTLSP